MSFICSKKRNKYSSKGTMTLHRTVTVLINVISHHWFRGFAKESRENIRMASPKKIPNFVKESRLLGEFSSLIISHRSPRQKKRKKFWNSSLMHNFCISRILNWKRNCNDKQCEKNFSITFESCRKVTYWFLNFKSPRNR